MMKNKMNTKTEVRVAVLQAIEAKNPKAIDFRVLGILTDEEEGTTHLGFGVNGIAFKTDWLNTDFVEGLALVQKENLTTLKQLKELDLLLQNRTTTINR